MFTVIISKGNGISIHFSRVPGGEDSACHRFATTDLEFSKAVAQSICVILCVWTVSLY